MMKEGRRRLVGRSRDARNDRLQKEEEKEKHMGARPVTASNLVHQTPAAALLVRLSVRSFFDAANKTPKKPTAGGGGGGGGGGRITK